ncbi:MAG: c-type cytochrome, partial [Myxococcota bacterium]
VPVLGCSDTTQTEPEPNGFRMLVEPEKPKGPALPDSSVWETPLADPALESGRVVWTGTCIQCHSTGLGGAPLIGNPDLWRPRIDQGLDVLVQHALEGFYGKKGEMPARGGNPDLTDEQVRLAVRFMATRVAPEL